MNNIVKQLAEGVMGWESAGNQWRKKVDELPGYNNALEAAYTHPAKVDEWDPPNDWNDCMMVVEQMRKQIMSIEITLDPEDYDVAIFTDPLVCYSARSKSLKEAICMAAIKALGTDAKLIDK